MTTNKEVNKAVTAFLALLAQANAVIANGPILSEWDTSDPTGDEGNEVVLFSWEDQEGAYNCKLTEGAIVAGQWKGESFFCVDHEGDEVQISLYKHVAITPPACKQCGSPLHGDYCSDQTCCYSDWPQTVAREDLKVFDTDEVEDKYGVKKRVTDVG